MMIIAWLCIVFIVLGITRGAAFIVTVMILGILYLTVETIPELIVLSACTLVGIALYFGLCKILSRGWGWIDPTTGD